MGKIKISLAQMRLVFGNLEENFKKVKSLIEESADKNVELLLLPELWSSGYDLENSFEITRQNKIILQEMAELAQKNNLIIAGSLLEEENGEIYNTFSLIHTSGQIMARYHKTHLFRLMNEHIWMKPGSRFVSLQLPFGKIGLATCYDLRFPELYRLHSLNGVQLVLMAAEWPVQRIDHWNTLLKARAIENQFFLAAVNVAGEIGGTNFGGNSAVIDPWGKVIKQANEKNEELIIAELDLKIIQEARNKLPVLNDRRTDLYS